MDEARGRNKNKDCNGQKTRLLKDNYCWQEKIMKISGVECASVWCENTDLYILNRLDVFEMWQCEGGCKA